jgi:Ca2+-binding RTX toxin-like protein
MRVRYWGHAAGARLIGVATATLAIAAASTSSAGAATVTHDATADAAAITFAAAAGEANVVTVDATVDQLRFGDAVALMPGGDCAAPAPTVDCPSVGVSSIAIALDDMDDRVTLGAGLPAVNVDGGAGADVIVGGPVAEHLTGGDGDDVLVGGAGADGFVGGAGDDTIAAADGVAESVDCGPGMDAATVDRGASGISDTVDPSCEIFMAPTPVPPGGTPPGPVPPPVLAPPAPAAQAAPTGAATPAGPAASGPAPGTAPGAAPGAAPAAGAPAAAPPAVAGSPRDLTPPSAVLRVGARGRISTVLSRGLAVPVVCGEACGISVAVVLDRPTALRLGLAGRSGPTILTLGSARRTLPGSSTVLVRLSRKARLALRRARRPVPLTVQALVSDGAGNGTLLQRRVTLRR